MKFTKLLSVFLAALMLFSCVAGALATGVSAGEGSEQYQFHYADPRDGVDPSLITTWYAGSFDAASGITTKAGSFQGLCKPIADETWAEGSVLVIKVGGSLFASSDNTNTSLKRYLGLVGGMTTAFRTDGTKLPIVMESYNGDGSDKILLNTKESIAQYHFANDFYFSGLTFEEYELPATTSYYAGSGLVTFHNCTIEYSSKLNFYGDSYNADPWYGWDGTKTTANKDASDSGLVETGFIFGKGTSFINAEGTATATPQIAAASNIGHYSNYKATETFPANNTAIDDTLISTYNTAVSGTRFYYGTTNWVVKDYNAVKNLTRPYDVKVNIMIDNGLTDGTLDFANIVDRQGTQPVGASEVSIYSGDVLSLWGDKGTDAYAQGRDSSLKSSTKEFYNGDITMNIGGNVGEVICVTDATLVGDFTLNVTGGEITKITAAYSTEGRTLITGDYEANISGGTIGTYLGGIATYGTDGTVTNNISDGIFTTRYFGARYACDNVINNISGGTFQGEFAGANNGTSNLYVGGTIVNTISGNDTSFVKTFYAANVNPISDAAWTSVKTTISGGQFGGIDKGTSFATTATLEIISESSDDVIKLGAGTCAVDSFIMNGGIIQFNKTKFTAEAAVGAVTLVNLGNWADTDDYSFLFKGAVNKLDVIPTQIGTDETNVGKVVEENGDISVTYGYVVLQTVAPHGAALVMEPETTAFGIRLFFNKAEVEALSSFAYVVKLGDEIIANSQIALETYGTADYALTIYNIGLEDMNKVLTFGGNVEGVDGFDISLASVTGLAIQQFTGNWQNWAMALQNLNNVHNKGEACGVGADLDKAYTAYVLEKGALQGDVSGVKVNFLMSNVTGISFVTTFATMPTNLVITVDDKDITSKAVVNGNVVILDIELPAQEMENDITVKVMNGTESYYTFTGSAAQLAQLVAGTDASAQAFLWYIQAAAAVVA